MGPTENIMATWVFISYKYHLDDFMTICQDYTINYDKVEFVDICRRTLGLLVVPSQFCVHRQWMYHYVHFVGIVTHFVTIGLQANLVGLSLVNSYSEMFPSTTCVACRVL